MNVPATLNDTYFRRDKKALRKQRQQQEGEIFASVKGGYTLNDTRKKDQVRNGYHFKTIMINLCFDVKCVMSLFFCGLQGDVDKQILGVVKSNKKDKKLLLKYLASPFSLRSGQFPHRMKF